MIFKKRLKKIVLAPYQKFSVYQENKKLLKCRETGIIDLPKRFIFDLTLRCNLNCKMCYFSKKENMAKEMTVEAIKEIFDRIKPDSISIVGAEPFMRRDILSLLEYFWRNKIEVTTLCTNATLITEEIAERLREYRNIKMFAVSIDGPEEIHNSIRGDNSAFQKATFGLEKIIKTASLPAMIVCVIMEENLGHLKEVVRLGHKYGVAQVSFEYERRAYQNDIISSYTMMADLGPFLSVNSKDSEIGYSFQDLKRALREVDEIGRALNIAVGYIPSEFIHNPERFYKRERRDGLGSVFCSALLKGRIDPYGNLIPCFAIRKPFGNLLKKELRDLWNSGDFKCYRKKLLQNNLLPICESCWYLRQR